MELASLALILLSKTATNEQRARAQQAADDHALTLAEAEERSAIAAGQAEALRARVEVEKAELLKAVPELEGSPALDALAHQRAEAKAASVASATKGA